MSGCKSGLNQYLVESIIAAKVLEMLNNGTLQAGLKACDTACDTYLGKGTSVVTCDSFSDVLCQAIEAGNTCLPFIDAFFLTGTVLTITAGDQTFPVDLAPLFAAYSDTKVTGFAFTSPTSNVLRVTQSDGTSFDADLSRLLTDAADIANIVSTDITVRNIIAALFKKCSGDDHAPGDLIPTCAEMTTAINTAITTAIGGLAEDKFLEAVSYDPDTNELTLSVNGGDTFTIPLTDLVDSLSISTDAGNQVTTGTDGGIYVPAPAAAGDTSKLLELSVAQLTTPAAVTTFTPMDITGLQNSADTAFATVDAATDTITFAAHTKPIIVELTVNAAFQRQTGGTDLDAGICLRESTGGGVKAFIHCQGRNAGEDNVQASGTAMFEVLPADTARTYTLTAVTQSSGTWTLKGFLNTLPAVTVKVTKT